MAYPLYETPLPTYFDLYSKRSQIRTVRSREPDTKLFPSGETASTSIQSLCPSKGAPIASPVRASQIRILWSHDADAMYLPEGRMTTDLTEWLCVCMVNLSSCVETVHTRTVLSSDPEMSCRPSGEKQTDCTDRAWPSKKPTCVPVVDVKDITQRDAEATVSPSGENAIDWTAYECWRSNLRRPRDGSESDFGVHRRTLWSEDPETRCLPSGE